MSIVDVKEVTESVEDELTPETPKERFTRVMKVKRFAQKQYNTAIDAGKKTLTWSARQCKRHYWIGYIVLLVFVGIVSYLFTAFVAGPVIVAIAGFSLVLAYIVYYVYVLALMMCGFLVGFWYFQTFSKYAI